MQVNGTIDVPQEIEGEEDALRHGVHVALRMIQERGSVSPMAIALTREGPGWRGLWQMDVTQAVLRGDQGMQELGYVLSKVVGPSGCDLSSMGVKPEHFKADAVLIVAEGNATTSGLGATPEAWRSVTVELRTNEQSCGHLYRVYEHGNETELRFIGRALKIQSPLNVGPAPAVLH